MWLSSLRLLVMKIRLTNKEHVGYLQNPELALYNYAGHILPNDHSITHVSLLFPSRTSNIVLAHKRVWLLRLILLCNSFGSVGDCSHVGKADVRDEAILVIPYQDWEQLRHFSHKNMRPMSSSMLHACMLWVDIKISMSANLPCMQRQWCNHMGNGRQRHQGHTVDDITKAAEVSNVFYSVVLVGEALGECVLIFLTIGLHAVGKHPPVWNGINSMKSTWWQPYYIIWVFLWKA